ncbi:ribonuclease Oy-like isoform X2 [Acanthaster planci]|nr:ribonuclease Oy-like isoform X2 [Acanthaster planci]
MSFSWDYLLFVNQWPESFCMYYNASHKHNNNDAQKCIIPTAVSTWTIHGLWPSKVGTEGPSNCNKSWPFQLNEIEDLIPIMNKTWPDLLEGGTYWNLWSHEWCKHGTCAASLPELSGEHKYFQTSLQLKQQIHIDKILSNSGIIPSSTHKYTLEEIEQAVKNGTGGTPILECYQERENSEFRQYIQEIRLCLDKSLKPFDCPKSNQFAHLTSAYDSPCSSKTLIALPAIKSRNKFL